MSDAHCFLAVEGERVLCREGDDTLRHSPCSTFKIVLALMGFDSGVLQNTRQPVWNFDESYRTLLGAVLENWLQPHDPTLWMKHSAVWYSQALTQKLGAEKFAGYVTALNYGNCDISGDAGKQNGLTHCWLSSSLTIAAREQIAFLQQLCAGHLPFAEDAIHLTKTLLADQVLPSGWQLYGKTGSGNLRDAQGVRLPDRQIGWFVGWVEKADRRIFFANFIRDNGPQPLFGGPRSKELALKKLSELLRN